MNNDLFEELNRFQISLLADAESDALLSRIAEFIREKMLAENAIIIGGKLLGNWWARAGSGRIKTYSVEVVRRAFTSEYGYCTSQLDQNPSDSQIQSGIKSCVAARVQVGSENIAALHCDSRNEERTFGELHA